MRGRRMRRNGGRDLCSILRTLDMMEFALRNSWNGGE